MFNKCEYIEMLLSVDKIFIFCNDFQSKRLHIKHVYTTRVVYKISLTLPSITSIAVENLVFSSTVCKVMTYIFFYFISM